jgi:hypothetical protein
LEARKLRARVNSVKSEWHHGDADRLIASPRPLLSSYGRARTKNQQRDVLFVFSRTRALLFPVKEIFGRDENKISNKFIFFLSILKPISSLKPAGEAETRTHVNKL